MSDDRCDNRKIGLKIQGEVAPPWAVFPAYARGSEAWRSGAGKAALDNFFAFIKRLPKDLNTRLAYLRRYPKAPFTWDYQVNQVIDPDGLLAKGDGLEDDDEDEDDWGILSQPAHTRLVELSLVASDIAYPTWLAHQKGVAWPWLTHDTPEEAARDSQRDFYFWGRQVSDARKEGPLHLGDVPLAWFACKTALVSGELPNVNPQKGAQCLALMLCVGEPLGPWQLDLTVHDYQDSYDMGRGYVDAYLAWMRETFEDQAHLNDYLARAKTPPIWDKWLREHLFI